MFLAKVCTRIGPNCTATKPALCHSHCVPLNKTEPGSWEWVDAGGLNGSVRFSPTQFSSVCPQPLGKFSICGGVRNLYRMFVTPGFYRARPTRKQPVRPSQCLRQVIHCIAALVCPVAMIYINVLESLVELSLSRFTPRCSRVVQPHLLRRCESGHGRHGREGLLHGWKRAALRGEELIICPRDAAQGPCAKTFSVFDFAKPDSGPNSRHTQTQSRA